MAHERREKYKEGKYILERLQLVDLEAASNGYSNTITRLLGPPSSATATTAAAAPGAGASPTNVMAITVMPENASPLSSSGERSPYHVIDGVLSPPPPPPPPPAPHMGFHDRIGLIQRSIASAEGVERRNQEERNAEMDSPPDLLPDGAEGEETPDLRAFFSSWAPPPPSTTAVAGAGDGEGVAVDDAVVGVPAAITDPPPHF